MRRQGPMAAAIISIVWLLAMLPHPLAAADPAQPGWAAAAQTTAQQSTDAQAPPSPQPPSPLALGACPALPDESGESGHYGFISVDQVFLAAIADDFSIARILSDAYDEQQRHFLMLLRNALVTRFKTWRFNSPVPRDALVDLMLDVEVMTRFSEPEREFLLSFEKSVHVRLSAYLLHRSLGRAARLPLNPGQAPQATPADEARNYAALHPLDMSVDSERVKALILIHLLRSEAPLAESWQRLQTLSSFVLGSAATRLSDAMHAANGLALARLSDLENPNTLTAFSEAWQRLSPPQSNDQGMRLTDPLAYLPINTSAFAASAGTSFAIDRPTLMLAVADPQPARQAQLAALSGRPIETFRQASARFSQFVEQHSYGWEALLFSPHATQALSPAARLALWTQLRGPTPLDTAPAKRPPPTDSLLVEIAPDLYAATARQLAARAQAIREQAKKLPILSPLAESAAALSERFAALAALEPTDTQAAIRVARAPEALGPMLVRAARLCPRHARALAVSSGVGSERGSLRMLAVRARREEVPCKHSPVETSSQDGDWDWDASDASDAGETADGEATEDGAAQASACTLSGVRFDLVQAELPLDDRGRPVSAAAYWQLPPDLDPSGFSPAQPMPASTPK